MPGEPVVEHVVPWAWWRPTARLIAAGRRYRRPPLLVVSMPRSGSSWLAATLGEAPEVAYLREPLTEEHARRRGGATFFEVDPDAPPEHYRHSADLAFAGIPRFGPNVVRAGSQWRLRDRSRRRVVIKEVNPLALRWLVSRYRPRVIYLVRHPAPVAASIGRQGWTGDAYTERLLPGRRDPAYLRADEVGTDFFARNGALQALVLRETLSFLASQPAETWRLVTYEDLCQEPATVFRALFDFAGVTWDAATEARVADRSKPQTPAPSGGYAIVRESTAMVDRWRGEMDPGAVDRVKHGYLLLDPPLYGPETW